MLASEIYPKRWGLHGNSSLEKLANSIALSIDLPNIKMGEDGDEMGDIGMNMKPFFISIPHSGEAVPDEVKWLEGLEEPVVMCDVDRFVDRLYQPVIEELSLVHILTKWHRYVVDLNRLPKDVDQDSVVGAIHESGTFTTGLHWSKTTRGQVLMAKPISQQLHKDIVTGYYWPFHHGVKSCYEKFKEQGHLKVYQIDAHSMPSMGTSAHRDPGQKRPQIVVSDVDGTSCEREYKDLVVSAYREAGFEVACNWPYKGGRVTQTYGKPDKGQHALQVELNRALYMDEETKLLDVKKSKKVSLMISQAVRIIYEQL